MRRARTLSVTAASALLAGLALAVVPASPAAAEEVVERPAGGVFAVEGHGWGHGRGMSQWGSQGAATLGRTAEEIVSTYYPGTTRTVLAPAPMRVPDRSASPVPPSPAWRCRAARAATTAASCRR